MHTATVRVRVAPHALALRIALAARDDALEPAEAPRHPSLVARASP